MAANKRAKSMKLVLVETFYIENSKIKTPEKNPRIYANPDALDLLDGSAGVYNFSDPFDKAQFDRVLASVRNNLCSLWAVGSAKGKPLHEHIATLKDTKHSDYCVRLEDTIVALRVRPLGDRSSLIAPAYFAVDYKNPKTLRAPKKAKKSAKKPTKKPVKKASA